MKIGIIGAGMIGTTLAQRLGEAGHDVGIANSRGPSTISAAALSGGAKAVEARDAPLLADVLIVTVPISRIPDLAPLVRAAPAGAVIIDTGNYYPLRDGRIAELESGQVESLWVQEQLGRPVLKAWNAITSQSFSEHATAAGTPDRIAIPVAGDDPDGKRLAMTLVEETGFDAFDAGPLADSWQQQPGTPAYCTERTAAELPGSLAAADAARSPRRRDLAIAVVTERAEAEGSISADYLVRLNRAIY
ncbi:MULTISPECIES: NADPH-dependent F420 reductase [unclassified Rathayibacter]|uniref:NADPH-dependent F420 reductase n=1 Tax=unclassified Rathayibacter TaxID=2609250 RepID=UPI001FB3A2B6|nr:MULTISPECIES: NAD(P)-binding domain-containing protein [unclassified Rathayibacter]MCJ1674510.1 NAD(P)-binding domain-containing protein [Rathayibacter sp. VKM Ac-2929]MCJ1684791.1 NAD(P)-binding domain-containing protein [Rathayibacter sp. VKM Ac-2928]MCJ1687427.1 NAD(P)-binding domain-containing protein [Rathayibacter sp. VKM Ac-2927]